MVKKQLRTCVWLIHRHFLRYIFFFFFLLKKIVAVFFSFKYHGIHAVPMVERSLYFKVDQPETNRGQNTFVNEIKVEYKSQ